MFRNDSEQKEVGIREIMDAEITGKDDKNKPHTQTFAKMVEWLKQYVNCPEFLASYSDQRSIELVAEATFWSVKLGLGEHLAKMSYTEIRNFKPLKESFLKKTERSKLINNVFKKMVKPTFSIEASYALGQAAFCVYIHYNSFEKLQKENQFYESAESMEIRSRL